MKKTILLLFLLLIISFNINAAIRYVTAAGAGEKNGSNWANAYDNTQLQTAINASAGGDQVWVAKGTYKPGSTRDIYFNMKTGVGVYGGFAGTETAISQRNILGNETILSGEIGTAAADDNCYTVVAFNNVNNSLIDGFTISGGFANGFIFMPNNGGGVYINYGHTLTLSNLKIVNNYAEYNGGGVFIQGATLINFINCLIGDNTQGGAAVSLYEGAEATFTNCTVTNNTGYQIHLFDDYVGAPTLVLNNSIVWGGGL